jgi:hypothetical protein
MALQTNPLREETFSESVSGLISDSCCGVEEFDRTP